MKILINNFFEMNIESELKNIEKWRELLEEKRNGLKNTYERLKEIGENKTSKEISRILDIIGNLSTIEANLDESKNKIDELQKVINEVMMNFSNRHGLIAKQLSFPIEYEIPSILYNKKEFK